MSGNCGFGKEVGMRRTESSLFLIINRAPEGTRHQSQDARQALERVKLVPAGTRQLTKGIKVLPEGIIHLPDGARVLFKGARVFPRVQKSSPLAIR
jgi:hypothetical protein